MHEVVRSIEVLLALVVGRFSPPERGAILLGLPGAPRVCGLLKRIWHDVENNRGLYEGSWSKTRTGIFVRRLTSGSDFRLTLHGVNLRSEFVIQSCHSCEKRITRWTPVVQSMIPELVSVGSGPRMRCEQFMKTRAR